MNWELILLIVIVSLATHLVINKNSAKHLFNWMFKINGNINKKIFPKIMQTGKIIFSKYNFFVYLILTAVVLFLVFIIIRSDNATSISVIVTCCIFCYNSIRNHILYIESIRPSIISKANFDNYNGEFEYRLSIKNCGQTVGIINSIDISPSYERQEGLDPNIFVNSNELYLAPNEEIETIIYVGKKNSMSLVDNRKICINYSPEYNRSKKYLSKHIINEIEMPDLKSRGNFTTNYYLKQIAESINKDK